MRAYIHFVLLGLSVASSSDHLALAQPQYDLLLQGGRVVDAKNKISAIRDVAIIFVASVGFGLLPGILALAVCSTGMLGKFYAEAIEGL